jgi:serine/threonine protein phosphatase PrpC
MTLLISTAEEMNPTRRNTMEDVHVIHAPQTWGAPHPSASFVGIYDGHGGRLIVDYLEENLAQNVAQEWTFDMNKAGKEDDGSGALAAGAGRKRRLSRSNGHNDSDDGSSRHDDDEEEERNDGKIIRNSLERAFLLTDIQSRMAGLTTSGATVVCTIIIPKFDTNGKCTEIEVHAANAGDARAVLSSTFARSASSPSTASHLKFITLNQDKTNNVVRITHDHKSTDPSEIERIKLAGGTMIRNRVLGILAVARSLGDHGLKEFVIAKPYLSSTVVKIIDSDSDDDDDDGMARNGKSNSPPTTTNNNNVSTSHPYTNGEFLIVACDGLWDVMEDDEAVDAVRAHVAKNGPKSRTDVATILVNEALERGSTDNITVVVYWL